MLSTSGLVRLYLRPPPISPKIAGQLFWGINNDQPTPRFHSHQKPEMKFTELTEIELPAAYDAHVHLRDGEMSQLVTPTIRKGGVNQVYVMVSLIPFFSHSRCQPFRFSLLPSIFLLFVLSFCSCVVADLLVSQHLGHVSLTHHITMTAEPGPAHHFREAMSRVPRQTPCY